MEKDNFVSQLIIELKLLGLCPTVTKNDEEGIIVESRLAAAFPIAVSRDVISTLTGDDAPVRLAKSVLLAFKQDLAPLMECETLNPAVEFKNTGTPPLDFMTREEAKKKIVRNLQENPT